MAGSVTLTASMRSNLLNLQGTQKLIDMTQNRLSTGLKVTSALDNPSSYFTAQSLNTRADELNALLDSMGQAIQTITAANDAITSLKSLVEQAKALANTARDTNNVSSYIKSSTNFNPVGAPTEIGAVGVGETFSIRTGETGTIKGTRHVILTQTLGDMGMSSTGTLSIKVGDNNFVKIQVESSDTIEAVTKKINDNTRLKGLVTASVVNGKFVIKTENEDQQLTIQALSTAGTSALTSGASGNAATALGLDVGYTITIVTAGPAVVTGDRIIVAGTAMTSGTTMTDLDISPTPATLRVAIGESTTDITIDNNETMADLVSRISAVNGVAAVAISSSGTLSVTTDNGKAIKITDISGNVARNLGIATSDYIKPTTGGMDALLTDLKSFNDNITAEIDKKGNLKVSSLNGESLIITDTINTTGVLGKAASSLGIEGLGDNGENTRAAYAEQFDGILDQIDQLVQNGDGGYKGVNLINGDDLTVNFNSSRTSSLVIKGAVLDTRGLGLNPSENEWKTSSDIDESLADVDTAVARLKTKASELGQNLNVIQTREDFTQNMVNTLTTGADDLTLADMNEEAANMLSLQTRQQLGVNALSLASQSQQSVLNLF